MSPFLATVRYFMVFLAIVRERYSVAFGIVIIKLRITIEQINICETKLVVQVLLSEGNIAERQSFRTNFFLQLADRWNRRKAAFRVKLKTQISRLKHNTFRLLCSKV